MFLADAAADNPGGGASMLFWLVYFVIIILIMYLLFIRPQKKQRQQMDELHNAMEPGDNIMTTGGFYGTILDIVDDTTVIVEFGNNKNCRIPMHKNAIAEVEKAGAAIVKDEDEAVEEPKKDSKKDAKAEKKTKSDK